MTNGRESQHRGQFIPTWLPWVLGIAALCFYFTTLNWSIALLPDWTSFFGSAPPAPRLLGWTFQPEFIAPAYYVATYPLRWLPEPWLPAAANVFAAVCAALTLTFLARSVVLLPHDRTRDQRERVDARRPWLTFPLAWLPPVFAVLVCAFQWSFWEHATNATVEMFDLLLFAFVIRCLLEYRTNEQETHLYRAAFVVGIGLTSNPAMVAFFPLFIVALVWLRELSFFNLRFLGKMLAFGLVGLLLLLVLPALGSRSANEEISFWALLKANLKCTQTVLMIFPKKTLLLLSLTSVLPVFLLSIRWASQFGDPSRIGAVTTTIIFHICHVVVLLACLWMLLDPAFSPRKSSFGFVMLPFYFLGALSVGYYSGYLLLVTRAQGTRLRPAAAPFMWLQRLATLFVFTLLIASPAALLHRNLPQLRLTNGPLQKQLTENLAKGLPKSGLILSDDPQWLWMVQGWLSQQKRKADFIPLCTQWLKSPDYHDYLKRLAPQWPAPARTKDAREITDSALVELLQKLAKEKEICYLHPSFGYYFESFAAEPHGLTQRLTPHGDGYLLPPPVSDEVIAQNKQFWAETRKSVLDALLPFTIPPDPTRKLPWIEKLYSSLGLQTEPNRHAATTGSLYARNLVSWGVELQKAGQFENAAPCFELAHELNPDNVVAEINLTFNQKYRRGESAPVEISKSIEDQFGKYRSWDDVLSQNGPYDEPSLSYAQGYAFVQGNTLRQAAQFFDRVRALSTNDINSRLWLAQLHLLRKFPDRTLAYLREIEDCARRTPGMATNITDLFTIEASAYFAKNEPDTATRILESNLSKSPTNFTLLATACKTYADNGRYTNALDLTDRMLKLDPDNPSCLLNRGCFLVEQGIYPEAIQSFNKLLTIETNNYVGVLYRAIANLRSDNLDSALKDYETVQRQYPKQHQVYYGLGEIAWRRKDTNIAIRHYESYLSNSPPSSAEAKLVGERIRELRGEKPAAAPSQPDKPK